ncbi:AaceriAAL153Cp [[Ashbya] aceris (nom. inval.)]|nr:AaceriAAL153Cp [[Ashbya] aceris (nom. inval.)]
MEQVQIRGRGEAVGNSGVLYASGVSACAQTKAGAVTCSGAEEQPLHWAESRARGLARHLHYWELPYAWRENRYIIYGHRFYHSHRKSLLSVVNAYGWHNETINIWSHLVGAAVLAYLLCWGWPRSDVYRAAQVPRLAKWAIGLFLLCGVKCMASSVAWHTFNGTCHLKLRSRFVCVDYTGITLLVTASVLTTVAVTLYGLSRPLMYAYMAASVGLGAAAGVMNWSPRFDRPEARPMRIAVYVGLAALGLVSFVHVWMQVRWASAHLLAPLLCKSLVWYGIGVVFYATLVPERWRSDVTLDCCSGPVHDAACNQFRDLPPVVRKNRQFWSLWWVDYFCHSHFLWHVFVVLGVVGHYRAVLQMSRIVWLDAARAF